MKVIFTSELICLKSYQEDIRRIGSQGQFEIVMYQVAKVKVLPWQSQLNANNSFVLSKIEFILRFVVPRDNRYQPQVLLLW